MRGRFRRWWWALLLVPLALGLSRVRLDVEVLNLLPDALPMVHGLKLYQRHFATGQELLVTLRAREAEAAETAARQLAESLRRETNLVVTAVWQPPWLDQGGQMAEFIAYLWLNQPPESLAALAVRLAPDRLTSVLNEAREQLATSLSPTELGRLGYDPCGLTRLPGIGSGGGTMLGESRDWFASADSVFRVVYVQPRVALKDFRDCARWSGQVRQIAGLCESSGEWPPGVRVRYTGGPAFVSEIATGMQRDLQRSIGGTLVIIAGLFWWAHRRWLPLLWLIGLLTLTVAGTMALGAMIFGTIHAISLGFAAVLLGLAADYALVLYQESVATPGVSAAELRRVMAPGILWSAATTTGAFAILMFGGLPGLSQLGALVAMGIMMAAGAVLYGFLPVVLGRCGSGGALPGNGPPPNPSGSRPMSWPLAGMTLLLLLSMALVLGQGWPAVDHSTKPLELAHSPAQAALDEVEKELNRSREPLLVLVAGRDEGEAARQLDAVASSLARAVTNRQLRRLVLPTAVWPRPEHQQANRERAAQLARQEESLRNAVLGAGFTTNALTLTEGILDTWRRAGTAEQVFWPTNEVCQWLLGKVAAWTGSQWLAAGMCEPGPSFDGPATLDSEILRNPDVWLTGWSLLGDALLQHVGSRLRWGLGVMVAVVSLCLWLAFRRWREVLLSFATLGFSLFLLLSVMRVAGWSWNLMNLTALPLLLGAGVDYTIHVQMALRRHRGDAGALYRVTGRALLLCAATTVTGFGSLGWSGNAGLASLGLVSAAGIACVFLTAVFLLPAWWRLWEQVATNREDAPSPLEPATGVPLYRGAARPSRFYCGSVWRVALFAARVLPARFCNGVCQTVAEAYYWINPARRRVVIGNLLPVQGGDSAAARRTARALFRQFGLKMADLWRYESGVEMGKWLHEPEGWETFQAARVRQRGVLLVTPHLGNWEMGGPLLAAQGVKLLAVSQDEPDPGLTELRRASRARWGIETVVVGKDGFGFVAIVKRLQEGTTVALLIDRPPPRSAVTIELFGRPFQASVAAAELARATGCALVGVTVLRVGDGYRARALPEFPYDRRALREWEARRQLTQQIMRAFEPEIRQHPDQWYHFVPIWPSSRGVAFS